MSIQELSIIAFSALPFTELRATIPLAITWGIAPWRAFMLAVLGNLIPVLPILFMLTPLQIGLARFFPALGSLLERILQRTRRKGEQVQKYGVLGLLLFVAVPLPGTGAWTGAVLAWLFGFPVGIAFTAIGGGVLIAGILVTLATLGFLKAVLYYGLEFMLVFLVLLAVIYGGVKWRKNRISKKDK